MSIRPHPLKLSLLVSVSSVMLLTACGQNRFTDMFSAAPGRKEQHIDLARRHPVLNPCFRTGTNAPNLPPCIADPNAVVAPPPAPAAVPAPQAAVAPQAPPRTVDNAFDEYDNSGQKIHSSAGTASFKPIEMQDVKEGEEEGTVNSSFFDRFFTSRGDKDPAEVASGPVRFNDTAPSAAPVAMQASNDSARKHFSGNPLADKAPPPVASASEPAPLVPQTDFKPVAASAPTPVMEEPQPAAASGFTPVEEAKTGMVKDITDVSAASEEPAPSRPSFFSRLMSPFKKTRGDETESVKESPQSDAAYPSLSSVPRTPDDFKAAKASRDEKIEELQMDHAMAQESKQSLAAEPSQTQESTPVAPMVVEKTVATTTTKISTPPANSEPQLLGHISDSAVAAAPAEPAAPVVVEQTTVVEEKTVETERKPWWKRLVGKDETRAAQEAAAAPASAEPASQPLASVPDFKPVETGAQQPPAPVEQVSPNTPAIANATQDDAKDDKQDGAAANANGLPDPDALQKVKALPPSRYEMRARDRQYYLVP